MPIYATHNRYPSVNPHLNSQLQQHGGGWKTFHTAYLNALYEMLDERLPSGYSATPEDSLQIRIYDPRMDGYPESIKIHGPDVLIRRSGTRSEAVKVEAESLAPTMSLSMWPVEVEEDDVMAILVHHEGRPVTRIEMLSPANKPGGSHQVRYEKARQETLLAGIRVVEIDLLHERRPTVERLPSYPDQEAGAWPYTILLMDPHPTFEAGLIEVYGFGVMEKLPVIDLPLEGDDNVRVNFDSLYHRVVGRRNFYEQIDYAQEPVNMAAYIEADQSAILNQMAAIGSAIT